MLRRQGDSAPLKELTEELVPTLVFGLGWDPARPVGLFRRLIGGGPKPVNLDAVAMAFDADGKLRHEGLPYLPNRPDLSILHSGDHRTGVGPGEDEQVFLVPNAIPPAIRDVVFAVVIESDHRFDQVENAFCRLSVRETGEELFSIDLRDGRMATIYLAGKLSREGEDAPWQVSLIGRAGDAGTLDDLVGLISVHL